MANIQEHLNTIKNSIYGKEVRGAIHDSIKQCYDDASVEYDNANMEVKLARGVYNTLNDRLEESDKIQKEFSSQLDNIAMYNEHKLPAKKYLGERNYYTVSFFGDSIIAGDYNEPIIKNRCPNVFWECCYNKNFNVINDLTDFDNPLIDGNDTITKTLSDTTFENYQYIMKATSDNKPRFFSDDFLIDNTKNYIVEFDIDSTLLNQANINIRVGCTTSTGFDYYEDNSYYNEKTNKKIYLKLDLNSLSERFGQITKIKIGFRLNTVSYDETVKISNIKLYKTNIIDNILERYLSTKAGVYDVGWRLRFVTTNNEKRPRYLTKIMRISEEMKNKKYVIKATIVKENYHGDEKIQTRLWLNDNTSNLVDLYNGQIIESGNNITILGYFDFKELLSKNPTATKFAYGLVMESTHNDSSFYLEKLEMVEVTKFVNVINNGISGDTTTGGVKRLQTVLDEKPNLCFIAFGTNDIRNGTSLETYLDNIKIIINELKNIGTTPIIATLPPLPQGQNNYNKVDEWNRQIKYFAVKNGCRVWDRFWHFENGDLKYIVDGRHPGTIGYRILGETSFQIALGELSN